MKNLKNQARKGVTMIEIVVVIAVLAILALFIVPRISGISASAQTTQSTADKKVVNDLLEAFQAAGGAFQTGAGTGVDNTSTTTAIASLLAGVTVNGQTFRLASNPANVSGWGAGFSGAGNRVP